MIFPPLLSEGSVGVDTVEVSSECVVYTESLTRKRCVDGGRHSLYSFRGLTLQEVGRSFIGLVRLVGKPIGVGCCLSCQLLVLPLFPEIFKSYTTI